MRYIGAGTHLAALTGGQLPPEVQQHHQVVRVNGAELYCRPFCSNIGAHLASVVESVDTATLKVAAYGRAGSSPAGGTTASLYKPSPLARKRVTEFLSHRFRLWTGCGPGAQSEPGEATELNGTLTLLISGRQR